MRIRNRLWIQELTEGCSNLQGYSLYRYKNSKNVPSSFFGKQLAQWPQFLSQPSVICRFCLVIALFCCARITGAHHVVHQVCAHPAIGSIRSMIYNDIYNVNQYCTTTIDSTIDSHAVLFSLPSYCKVVATYSISLLKVICCLSSPSHLKSM